MADKVFMDFLKLHFTPETGMYSYVICGCRGKSIIELEDGSTKQVSRLHNCFYIKTDEISEENPVFQELQECIKSRDYEYYLTQNGFNHPKKRDAAHLFTLHNMVIDIDCHDRHMPKNELDFYIEAGEYTLYNLFDMPGFIPPNTVVRTGRGLQLWWALKPVSHKLRYMYDEVRSSIVKSVEDALDDAGLSQFLHVDKAASKNYAGLFRLPGSWNAKSKTKGSYDILHKSRLNLMEEYFCGKKESKKKTCTYKIPSGKKNGYMKFKKAGKDFKNRFNLLHTREKMLYELLKLRGKKDKKGYRDLMLLVLHSAYMSLGKEEEEAWNAVLRLNESFPEPLEIHNIKSYLSSSVVKKYKFSNKKIIEILGMTEKECNILDFHPYTGYHWRAEENKKKKSDRNQKVVELFLLGKTQQEISSETGCSQSTVCRILKKQDAKRKPA